MILLFQFSCNSIDKSTNSSSRERKTEDFKIFLEKFKTDSTFQVSRISFPLTHEFIGESEDAETIVSNIDTENWRYMPLKYDKSFATRRLDAYTEKYVTEKKSARLIYQGVDNGINVEFIFELKNEKWYLIRWNDFSD